MTRVLDCGCHDGFVGAWLRERFGEDVELHGMELHPDAAAKARERGYTKVIEAPAEEAPNNYPPGHFDAVVAFELIEHVPDPVRLLRAAELVLAPGGRIYISTPAGTFGAGNNPNHLRAYRPVDLADLLRRRGQIQDLQVGNDGVTVASYIPAERRGEIAIFTGPGWQRWAPFDIETKGLGGSETAAVRLGEQLASQGYIVTVYGEVEESCFADVIYRHWTAFDPAERRLAVISSRMPQLAERPLNAQARLLWLHDIDCGDALTERFADGFDRILVLSEWHEQHVKGRYHFAAHKVLKIRNGIHLPYFDGDQPERQQRVVYTSSPDRGLDILLELWPQIRERVPDAELHHAYSPVYFEVAKQDPTIGAHHAKIRELSGQDGVTAIGSLSQPQVAKLMRESLVWAHPSWATPYGGPFHETFCIGAVEAQAAGCHVVASDWGALRETVKVGALVNGDAPGERWRAALVQEIVRGLTDEATQRHAQEQGPKAVADLGWDGVATAVAGLCEGEKVPA